MGYSEEMRAETLTRIELCRVQNVRARNLDLMQKVGVKVDRTCPLDLVNFEQTLSSL